MTRRRKQVIIIVNVVVALAMFASPLRSIFTWSFLIVMGVLTLISLLPVLVLSPLTGARDRMAEHALGLAAFAAAMIALTSINEWMN